MKDAYWHRKNVFVTGCTGLLGAWLTQSLCDQGANVVGLVRDQVPKSNLYLSGYDAEITAVRGSLTDLALLERILNEYEIDTVFHLAAQTIVTIANRSPLSTFESNIRGTWNLLEAIRRLNTVQRTVVASSDKAYGEHPELPYSEEYPLQGRHPYDASKSCVDLITQAYANTYELPLAIARCGNIYGGGDLNFNRVIPGTIRDIYYGDRPVIRSDGKPERDYIYVLDAVSAYLLLARSLDDKAFWGEAFNFSNEEPIDVLSLVQKIVSLSDKPDLQPNILGKGPQPGEIHRQYLSSKKAKIRLSWNASYPLADGLSETIKWYYGFFEKTAA